MENSSLSEQKRSASVSSLSKDEADFGKKMEDKGKKKKLLRGDSEPKIKEKREKSKERKLSYTSSDDESPRKAEKRHLRVIERIRRFGSREELDNDSYEEEKTKKKEKKKKKVNEKNKGSASKENIFENLISSGDGITLGFRGRHKVRSVSEDGSSDEEEFAKEVLTAINHHRKKHAVKKLKINKELNTFALEWAKMLTRGQEVKERKTQKYGKNIYIKSLSEQDKKVKGESVVEEWYSELENYDFGEPQDSDRIKNGTQILWGDTREVGIGRAKDEESKMVFVTAYFNPRGNVEGEYKNQVPPPGGFRSMDKNSNRADSLDEDESRQAQQEKPQEKAHKKNFISQVLHKFRRGSDGDLDNHKKEKKKENFGRIGYRQGKYVLNNENEDEDKDIMKKSSFYVVTEKEIEKTKQSLRRGDFPIYDEAILNEIQKSDDNERKKSTSSSSSNSSDEGNKLSNKQEIDLSKNKDSLTDEILCMIPHLPQEDQKKEPSVSEVILPRNENDVNKTGEKINLPAESNLNTSVKKDNENASVHLVGRQEGDSSSISSDDEERYNNAKGKEIEKDNTETPTVYMKRIKSEENLVSTIKYPFTKKCDKNSDESSRTRGSDSDTDENVSTGYQKTKIMSKEKVFVSPNVLSEREKRNSDTSSDEDKNGTDKIIEGTTEKIKTKQELCESKKLDSSDSSSDSDEDNFENNEIKTDTKPMIPVKQQNFHKESNLVFTMNNSRTEFREKSSSFSDENLIKGNSEFHSEAIRHEISNYEHKGTTINENLSSSDEESSNHQKSEGLLTKIKKSISRKSSSSESSDEEKEDKMSSHANPVNEVYLPLKNEVKEKTILKEEIKTETITISIQESNYMENENNKGSSFQTKKDYHYDGNSDESSCSDSKTLNKTEDNCNLSENGGVFTNIKTQFQKGRSVSHSSDEGELQDSDVFKEQSTENVNHSIQSNMVGGIKEWLEKYSSSEDEEFHISDNVKESEIIISNENRETKTNLVVLNDNLWHQSSSNSSSDEGEIKPLKNPGNINISSGNPSIEPSDKNVSDSSSSEDETENKHADEIPPNTNKLQSSIIQSTLEFDCKEQNDPNSNIDIKNSSLDIFTDSKKDPDPKSVSTEENVGKKDAGILDKIQRKFSSSSSSDEEVNTFKERVDNDFICANECEGTNANENISKDLDKIRNHDSSGSDNEELSNKNKVEKNTNDYFQEKEIKQENKGEPESITSSNSSKTLISRIKGCFERKKSFSSSSDEENNSAEFERIQIENERKYKAEALLIMNTEVVTKTNNDVSKEEKDQKSKSSVPENAGTNIAKLKHLFEISNSDKLEKTENESKQMEVSHSLDVDYTEFRNEILKHINSYRFEHRANPLILSAQLCKIASERAENFACGIIGNIPSTLGENVFFYPSAGALLKDAAEYIVLSWYKSNVFHEYGTEPSEYDIRAGSFTQLVWRNSKELGIGLSVNARENRTTVVAMFSPGGNVKGRFAKQVKPINYNASTSSSSSSEDDFNDGDMKLGIKKKFQENEYKGFSVSFMEIMTTTPVITSYSPLELEESDGSALSKLLIKRSDSFSRSSSVSSESNSSEMDETLSPEPKASKKEHVEGKPVVDKNRASETSCRSFGGNDGGVIVVKESFNNDYMKEVDDTATDVYKNEDDNLTGTEEINTVYEIKELETVNEQKNANIMTESATPGAGANEEDCEEFVVEMLWEINKRRNQHEAPELLADEKLKDVSRQRCKELRDKGEVTINLDASVGESIYVGPKMSAKELIDNWYLESKNYKFRSEPPWGVSNAPNFTQMIWKSSKHFGAFRSFWNDDRMVVVATFQPRGNISGRFMEHIKEERETKRNNSNEENEDRKSFLESLEFQKSRDDQGEEFVKSLSKVSSEFALLEELKKEIEVKNKEMELEVLQMKKRLERIESGSNFDVVNSASSDGSSLLYDVFSVGDENGNIQLKNDETEIKSSQIVPHIQDDKFPEDCDEKIKEKETTMNLFTEDHPPTGKNSLKGKSEVSLQYSAELTTKERKRIEEEFMEKLNFVRDLHQVKPLALNKELCGLADVALKEIANGEGCKFPYQRVFGENYLILNDAEEFDATRVLKEWYEPSYNFRYGVEPSNITPEIESFCQMVWKSTREIGFSFVQNSLEKKIWFLAFFDPKGNWHGMYSIQILPLRIKEGNSENIFNVPLTSFETKNQDNDSKTPHFENSEEKNNDAFEEQTKSSSSTVIDSSAAGDFDQIKAYIQDWDNIKFSNELLNSVNRVRNKRGAQNLLLSTELNEESLKLGFSSIKKDELQINDDQRFESIVSCERIHSIKTKVLPQRVVDSWVNLRRKSRSLFQHDDASDQRKGNFEKMFSKDLSEFGAAIVYTHSKKGFVVASFR